MSFCHRCGTPVEGKFCPVCGAENAVSSGSTVQTESGAPVPPPYGWTTPSPFYTHESQKPPMSVGGWVGRMLIPCIPVVGGLIYLILLIVWMGDENKDESFRNWAKAQLIMMLISLGIVVVTVFLFVFVLGLGWSMMSSVYY